MVVAVRGACPAVRGDREELGLGDLADGMGGLAGHDGRRGLNGPARRSGRMDGDVEEKGARRQREGAGRTADGGGLAYRKRRRRRRGGMVVVRRACFDNSGELHDRRLRCGGEGVATWGSGLDRWLRGFGMGLRHGVDGWKSAWPVAGKKGVHGELGRLPWKRGGGGGCFRVDGLSSTGDGFNDERGVKEAWELRPAQGGFGRRVWHGGRQCKGHGGTAMNGEEGSGGDVRRSGRCGCEAGGRW